MSQPLRRILVVGAGLAGVRAVDALRRRGFDAAITVVGAEPHPPYTRPPLSKDFLVGKVDGASLELPLAGAVDEWVLGCRVTAADVRARRVSIADGRTLTYDGLVIATGTAARQPPWPGADLRGVFALRTMDDACRLRAALASRPRLAVLGAGFIGCEVAATARRLGCEVTLVDVAVAPLAQPLGPSFGHRVGELHRENGVRLRMGVGVRSILGAGRVEAVELVDGSRLAADVAVVGIGAVPNVDWLVSSGLDLDNGVVCGADLRASAPGVVAAGDVARWPNPAYGGRTMRVEHWTHAATSGAAAARTLLQPEVRRPFSAIPTFWSDQYDVKIQSLGLPVLADEPPLLRGSMRERQLVAEYTRQGRLVGAVTVNMTRELTSYRQRLLAGW